MISFPMSPDILAVQGVITQNNDLYGGRRALYKNRKLYVPQLTNQEDGAYDAMVGRTPAYILYPAIVEGFLGSIFTKEPAKTLPVYDGYNNIDLLGNTIDQYSTDVTREVLKQGFCASFVDYSKASKKPFLRFVNPESFTSIKVETVNDVPVVARFIFKEIEEVDDENNEFATNYIDTYTVLDIFDGKYRIRKYKEVKATSLSSTPTTTISLESIVPGQKNTPDIDLIKDGEDVYPVMNSKTLPKIPIVLHGTDANNFTIRTSRLQDISDLNISIFQRTVDQIHMLHYTALPTPYITGMDADDDNAPDTIGPDDIWFVSNPEAKVGLLEFSGASAEAHQNYINNLKDIMASIGAQILKDQGISRETATSVLIRNNSQTITISAIVNNITSQMLELLMIYTEWAGLDTSEVAYKLNADFVRVDMDPNAQIALVKSWMDGAVSHESLFEKFKEGEIVPGHRTFEEELALIEKNPSPKTVLELKKGEAEIENAKRQTDNAIEQTKQNPDYTGKGQNKNYQSGKNTQTGSKTGDSLSSKQV